jgi:hypothetical protein
MEGFSGLRKAVPALWAGVRCTSVPALGRCLAAAARSAPQVADRNGLPVKRITEVTVLDPYFYRP